MFRTVIASRLQIMQDLFTKYYLHNVHNDIISHVQHLLREFVVLYWEQFRSNSHILDEK